MICTKQNFGRNLCTALYFFFSGVEYAVILPTLNGYLISLHAPDGFIGIIMASFSFTGIIAAPIFGRITDKTGSTKWCVIISNFFEIGGNFLYFVGGSYHLLWISRLVAGIGSGASSSILGMLSRATTPEERTGAFSLLMAMRQIGLLIGPGFNVFLNSLNFTLGPFMLNQFTSPGLFMVGIWFIHTVLMFILFKDIEANPDALVQTNAAPKDQVTDHSVQGENGLRHRLRSISISTAQAKTFFNEFIREEVIVCLSATFMIMFSQTGIEAAVTPMTLLLFDWGGLFNSYMFCGAGFVVIVSYVSLSFLSKRFSDRSLLIAGCFGTIITYSVLLGYILSLFLQNNVENPAWLLPMFIIDTILLTISLPFLWVPQASLFSKVTSIETQAFNQGIRLAAMGCGQILGPIWASVMATESRLPIMAGVDLLMVLLVTGMVIMSYKKLVVPIEPSHSQPKPSLLSQPDSESSPLLSASINV